MSDQGKKKIPVKKDFQISPELRELAEKVIDEQKMDIYPAKIEYLLVYPNISKTVAGKCVRSAKELKFFSGFDYLIEMSGELWDSLDDSVRYVLMQHELMHILPTMNEKTGDWEFKIRDHDVQDFYKIIDAHGIDWLQKVKLSMSSLYEIDSIDVKL